MKCSICNTDIYNNAENSFSITGWKKLVVQSVGPAVFPAVYRPNYVESDPYIILCPRCYQERLGAAKKKVDVTSIKTKELECDTYL